MFYRFYPPHPQLQDIVSNLMIYSHRYDRDQPLPVNLFPPIPEHSLYFYPRDPLIVHRREAGTVAVCEPSIIVGPQVARVNLSLGYDHLVVRVGFRPGGLFRLLQLPMHELVDQNCNTADFFGSAVADVTEQLALTNDPDEMRAIVYGFLLGRLRKTGPRAAVDGAFSLLMKAGGNLSIDHLAKESFLSARQFERRCKERIGLSPKLFARIVRFSKAYRLRELRPDLTWTGIAHSAGYYDQMHFIRDFKAFTGALPTAVDEELSLTPVRLQADLKL